ncbi:FAD-binding oxidoreductase [Niveibacterium umoris]|uniref:FAD/FMN-containing dehydrogenase n=1 Tax=Niveibacterium umoris TaxID=1193620 RepID=A0A840BHZ0_9RHOO|nr:FAD-binding oxidoreductase [Niveibacterium umoris]MBB4011202.1 FAD/FMN-containing dehydrogenase [Niveibacterium umoris]
MDLVAELVALLGGPHVITADADQAPYLQDWRGRYTGRVQAVVRPATTEEVAAVVRLCRTHGAPMVPQGGNTSLCGGATPDDSGKAVLISLQRLNHIRALDTDNDTLTVEAGCTLAEVQAAAAEADRLFPLSLASEGTCRIGGNLSTNAGGVHVLRYGNARDLVLGLEVVLPDGQVWNGLRALRKDNTGYDLKHLFLGAEGTLGLITAAVLKLSPRPRSVCTAWVAVTDPAAAVALLRRFRTECGERLSAFELMSQMTLALVLRHIPGAQNPLAEIPSWSVLVELSDTRVDAALDRILESVLAPAMESGAVLDAAIASSEAQRLALWGLRENASEAQRHEGVSVKHDVSVPVSRIPEFLRRADAALTAAFPGIRIVAFGHVGDGNLHYNCSKPAADENAELLAEWGGLNRIVHDLAHELGGSISAEHGLGQLKRGEIRRYKSALEMDLMERIKRAFDPDGLMNPGKVL